MRSSVTVLAGTLVALLVAACGSDSYQDADIRVQPAPGSRAAQQALSIGRWEVGVTVKPSRLGPIVFAARNLVPAKRTGSKPWIRHALVFRNTSDRPVTFADTRSSAFIGDAGQRRLLAADERCGYSLDSPKAPAQAGACHSYLDLLTVKPHTTAERTITLFRALRGMDRLVSGTYVFRHPVRFQFRNRMPDEREGRSGILRLAYEVQVRFG